ncbi:MAG: helix-turn-helix domain-containing protein [Clostridia bacterium]|nr:helix-turn-helix domain-containing protein [Clostridia bacterium]
MDRYITAGMIRRLREARGMTQEELAQKIYVSSKAVSKWETGQGLPDISLLEPLAAALEISVTELLSGCDVRNENRNFNMHRVCFYMCPVCGNIVQSTGKAMVSCCGITLPPLQAENAGGEHALRIEPVEDEFYVTLQHPMSKTHFISFLAAVTDQGVQLVKLYPEGPAEARFKRSRVRWVYACCNRDGLFRIKV